MYAREYMKRTQKENVGEVVEKFAHKKSLGQNFLTSDVVPNWLTLAGEVAAHDIVLEIGPGTGALTNSLLQTGARVVAIETDSRAVVILEEKFSEEILSGKLTLIKDDVRSLDIKKLGLNDHEFKVVANIPYYLSGFLLRTLLETTTQPSLLAFLMQKEVVARIARDKKESILSLSVKAFGEPKYVKTVSRGHFNPPPKVDSAILLIKNISRDSFASKSVQDLYFELLHLGFGQKRKQLLSNFSHKYDRFTLTSLFTTLNLKTTVRAEDIPLATWINITHNLHSVPKKNTA